MREEISQIWRLTLAGAPFFAWVSSSMTRLRSALLVVSPPQRTSRSAIGVPPLAELASHLLEGHVGEAACLLCVDPAFVVVRLGEPLARVLLEDARGHGSGDPTLVRTRHAPQPNGTARSYRRDWKALGSDSS